MMRSSTLTADLSATPLLCLLLCPEKYSETLVDIDNNITSAEKSLASLIDNLTGSDNDMAGLREFQNSFAMSKIIRHNTPLLAPEVIENLCITAHLPSLKMHVSKHTVVNENLVKRNWEKLGQIIGEGRTPEWGRPRQIWRICYQRTFEASDCHMVRGFSRATFTASVQFYKTTPCNFPIGDWKIG